MGLPVAALIPSIISGAASLLGGGISALSQSSANKSYLQGIKDTNAANLQISRETNKQNLDMFNRQLAYNTSMYEKTNEYNSPLAARSRLIQAGISPAQMAAAGSAQSIAASSANPAVAARMEAPGQTPNPYGVLAQAVGGSVGDFLENRVRHEVLRGSQLDNQMKGIDLQFRYDEKYQDLLRKREEVAASSLSNQEKDMRLRYLDSELSSLQSLRNQQLRANEAGYDNLIAEGEKIRSDIALNNAAIERTFAEIRHMSESDRVAWFNAQVGAQLTKHQIRSIDADIDAKQLANRLARLTFNDDVERSRLAAQIGSYDAQQKSVILYNLMQDTEVQDNLRSSWFRDFIGTTFGIDVASLFSGAGTMFIKSGTK